MTETTYSDCDDLVTWSQDLMRERKPDFVIGQNYLRRWWVFPRNKMMNLYLHEINKSDDDRALHDHPWDNVSLLIKGSYIEHTPEGSFTRNAGETVFRKATDSHRLEVPSGSEGVISLFWTGPLVREWGFHCPQGWRHWKDFTAYHETGESGQIGRGCGEMPLIT